MFENIGNYFWQITKIKMSLPFIRPKAAVHKRCFNLILFANIVAGLAGELNTVQPFGKVQHIVIKSSGKQETENYQVFWSCASLYSLTSFRSISTEFLQDRSLFSLLLPPPLFNKQMHKHLFLRLEIHETDGKQKTPRHYKILALFSCS